MKRTVFSLLTFLILSGCATTPSQQAVSTVVFYPPPPLPPRLQFLHTIGGEDDLGGTRSAFSDFLLGKPQSEKRIGKPYDIGSSPGKIYVLDRIYKKLLIIDLAKRTFDYLRDQRQGALSDPSGIWITPDDIKYIADMQRKQVVVFGRDNAFARTYGGKDLFAKPVDVAVYEQTVYVCDMLQNKIFLLDKATGAVKSTIGGAGTEEGRLNKPTHVVVDQAGHLFVTDAFNFRVQQFDPAGRFIKSFGFLGDSLGAFARPKGLDVDRSGHVYVADAAFENVQIFNARTAQLLLFFGGSGNAPGSMYLPSGIHVDYANAGFFTNFADKSFKLAYVVYVGNTFGGNKLNVYGFGEWAGGPFAPPAMPGSRPTP